MATHGRLGRDEGQALVEFALVLPLVALIIFGIIELTSLYRCRFIVLYADFMSARCAAVHPSDADTVAQDACRTIVGAALDPKILIPVVGKSIMKPDTRVTTSSIEFDLSYSRVISSPIVAAALSPLGRLTGFHVIKLQSTVTLPRFVTK